MFIDTKQMIGVTQLQKSLAKKVKEIHDTGKPLLVLKNNESVAFLVDSDEYEYLKELEEIVEHFEIADMLEERMSKHDPGKDVNWEKLKGEYGL